MTAVHDVGSQAPAMRASTAFLAAEERRAVWVVIPCYNEDATLDKVLAEVARFGYSIVVVDDGSKVAATSLVTTPAVQVLRHCVNLGQGAALQTGIDFALLHGARFVVTFDSDGQHRAEEIGLLVDALLDRGCDVALGTRFGAGGRAVNISRTRKLVLRLAIRVSRYSTGLEITDTHNGFRAMTRAAATRIRITQNRMAHASQILDEIARLSMSYVEVPVTVQYTDYSLKKGQRMSNAFNIIWESLTGRIS